MADSVKNLVVKLQFEHGDTKQQISNIKAEMNQLDSAFAAANAGANAFSSGMNESASKAAMLTQKLQLQEGLIQRYGTALKAAKDALEQAKQKQQNYADRIDAAKDKQAQLAEKIAATKAAMEAEAEAGGKDSEAYKALAEKLAKLQEQHDKTGRSIDNLERSMAKNEKTIAKGEQSVSKWQTELNKANGQAATMKGQLDDLNTRVRNNKDYWDQAAASLKGYSDEAKTAAEWQGQVGNFAMKGTAAIVAAGTAAVGAGIAWESSFAGVRKTVNGTEEDLAAIEQQLLDMGGTKSATITDLAGIAEAGGQLGIATENIVGFTGVMADLAETTNLTADGAATAFAQYANITGMSQGDFDRMGSTIVALGNNTATTEADIVNFATAIAAAGRQAGLTDSQILGFSAGFASVGLEAAAGGTAFSKALVGMQVAVETGSDDLQKYADIAGMTAEQFASVWKNDAAAAFQAFIEGLGSGSDSAIVMLQEMGITETRMRDAMLRASSASDLFASSVDLANQAWAENTALATEASVRYQTTGAQLAMLGNRAQRTAINFGQSLMPALQSGLDTVSNLVEKFNGLDESQRGNIIRWAAYVAAVGPATKALSLANSGIAKVTGAMSSLATAMGNGGGLAGGLKAIGAALGPAGIAAVAVAAGVAAVKFLDWAMGAKAAREAMADMKTTVENWSAEKISTVFENGTTFWSLFGVDQASFSASQREAETWLDDLVAVWTDGKSETSEQVQSFIDSWTQGSDDIRSAISGQRTMGRNLGLISDEDIAQMDADIATLDSYDQEIGELLRKRQNGILTADDQARLQELLDLRAEIQLRYDNGTTGFTDLVEGYQSTIDRLHAQGETANAETFAQGMAALAAGRQAYNESLDESYAAEHARIMSIDDEAARLEALAALDAQYSAQRAQGEQAYADAVAQLAGTTAGEMDFLNVQENINALAQLIGEYDDINQIGESDLTAIADAFADIDPTAMVEMLGLIEQMRSAGMSDSDIEDVLGFSPTDVESAIQQIRNATKGVDGLETINEAFGSDLAENMVDLAVNLDMTEAEATWTAFLEGKDVFETTGTVDIIMDPTSRAEAESFRETVGDAVIMKVGLVPGWTTAVTDSLNEGITTITGADGSTIEITPEIAKLLPSDFVQTDENGNITVQLTPEAVSLMESEGLITGLDEDGNLPVWVSAAVDAGFVKIDANDLVAVDEDGTMHIKVVADVGSSDRVDAAMNAGNKNNLSGTVLEPISVTTNEEITRAIGMAQAIEDLDTEIENLRASGAYANEVGQDINTLTDAKATQLGALNEAVAGMTDTDWETIGSQVSAMMAALASGELDPTTAQQYQEYLSGILTLIDTADTVGMGDNMAAGIAKGMESYGYTPTGEDVVSSIEDAINSAADAHSPAKRFYEPGENMAAGIEQGMKTYSFGSSSAIINKILSSFRGLNGDGKTIGTQFGAGLNSGLQSKMNSSIELARKYANNVKQVFRDVWDIHSPSKEAAYLTGMFGAGLEKGMESWPKVSEKLLQDDILTARRGIEQVTNTSTDNRNYASSVNVSVDTLEVKRDQDIRKLAQEIAALTKRSSAGKGRV